MIVSRLSVGTLVFILSCALLLGLRLADADVPPAGYGQPSGEFDITLSRVPVAERAAAKALKPPFQPTPEILAEGKAILDRKSTRLNSSHLVISYAVFCLKKKKK